LTIEPQIGLAGAALGDQRLDGFQGEVERFLLAVFLLGGRLALLALWSPLAAAGFVGASSPCAAWFQSSRTRSS
jgi:hypothetical protein